MSSYKHSKCDDHSFSKKDFVPGTYQIVITRMEENGRKKSLTAYVPMNRHGRDELLRRHFEGHPHKKPEYFVK